MVSDYFLTTSALSMTEEERRNLAGMRASWKALAQDLEGQWDSPLLFPAKAPPALLAALPPTVIFSAEFDMFITETDRLVRRMRSAGSLIDHCCMPGQSQPHRLQFFRDPFYKLPPAHQDCMQLQESATGISLTPRWPAITGSINTSSSP